jgi:hypothetical protein
VQEELQIEEKRRAEAEAERRRDEL